MELGSLAAEVLRRGVEEVGQRTLLVRAVGPERDGEVVEAGVDLVQLERHRGAVLGQGGAAGEHRSAAVGRRELHEAVAHDRRGDDHGLGVLRDLHVRVVVHRDDHVGARRGDRVDLPHRHAQHAHVAALVDRHGARELRGQGLLLSAAEEERHDADDDQRQQHQRQHDLAHDTQTGPHLNHPPAGPAACSGCRCRTTARCRACWRRPGRTAPSAADSGRCRRSPC